jgi:hypothetical protein
MVVVRASLQQSTKLGLWVPALAFLVVELW